MNDINSQALEFDTAFTAREPDTVADEGQQPMLARYLSLANRAKWLVFGAVRRRAGAGVWWLPC